MKRKKIISLIVLFAFCVNQIASAEVWSSITSKIRNISRPAIIAPIKKSITSRVSNFKSSATGNLSSPSKMYNTGKNLVGSYLKHKLPAASYVISNKQQIKSSYQSLKTSTGSLKNTLSLKATSLFNQSIFSSKLRQEKYWSADKIAEAKTFHYQFYDPQKQKATFAGEVYTKEQWDDKWAKKEAYFSSSTLTRGQEHGQAINALIVANPGGAVGGAINGILSYAGATIKYLRYSPTPMRILRPSTLTYISKIKAPTFNGLKNMMRSEGGSLFSKTPKIPNINLPKGISQGTYTPISHELKRGITSIHNSNNIKGWLVSSAKRIVGYEIGLYTFRQSGLEDAIVPVAYRPAIDTTLNYVVPFFLTPGSGMAKTGTTAFFSKEGSKKFITEGLKQVKNLTSPTLIKSTLKSIPSKLTLSAIKNGTISGLQTYKKEIIAGYTKLGSEGKVWIPIQILRQSVHVARDLSVFNAGMAGSSMFLNKAGVKTIPYVGWGTLEASDMASALNTISDYAAAGSISGLFFGSSMAIAGPAIGPIVSRTPVLGSFMRWYDDVYGNKLFETAGLERKLAGTSFWKRNAASFIKKFNNAQNFLVEEFWVFREPLAGAAFSFLSLPAGASEYLEESITDYGRRGSGSIGFGLGALNKIRSGEAEKTITKALDDIADSLIGVGKGISRGIGEMGFPNPLPMTASAMPDNPGVKNSPDWIEDKKDYHSNFNPSIVADSKGNIYGGGLPAGGAINKITPKLNANLQLQNTPQNEWDTRNPVHKTIKSLGGINNFQRLSTSEIKKQFIPSNTFALKHKSEQFVLAPSSWKFGITYYKDESGNDYIILPRQSNFVKRTFSLPLIGSFLKGSILKQIDKQQKTLYSPKTQANEKALHTLQNYNLAIKSGREDAFKQKTEELKINNINHILNLGQSQPKEIFTTDYDNAVKDTQTGEYLKKPKISVEKLISSSKPLLIRGDRNLLAGLHPGNLNHGRIIDTFINSGIKTWAGGKVFFSANPEIAIDYYLGDSSMKSNSEADILWVYKASELADKGLEFEFGKSNQYELNVKLPRGNNDYLHLEDAYGVTTKQNFKAIKPYIKTTKISDNGYLLHLGNGGFSRLIVLDNLAQVKNYIAGLKATEDSSKNVSLQITKPAKLSKISSYPYLLYPNNVSEINSLIEKIQSRVPTENQLKNIRLGRYTSVGDPSVDLKHNRLISGLGRIINPEKKDLVVFYPGAQADIADPLVSTDASELILIDITDDPKLNEILQEELERIGAKNIAIKRGNNKYTINFDWENKPRTIHYYIADALRFWPQELNKGFNVYYRKNNMFERGSENIQALSEYHKKVYGGLKKGGFAVIDGNITQRGSALNHLELNTLAEIDLGILGAAQFHRWSDSTAQLYVAVQDANDLTSQLIEINTQLDMAKEASRFLNPKTTSSKEIFKEKINKVKPKYKNIEKIFANLPNPVKEKVAVQIKTMEKEINEYLSYFYDKEDLEHLNDLFPFINLNSAESVTPQTAKSEEVTQPLSNQKQRIEIIKNDLFQVLQEKGIKKDEINKIELNKLAKRIYAAQITASGNKLVEISVEDINIPGIDSINPQIFGTMGMGGMPTIVKALTPVVIKQKQTSSFLKEDQAKIFLKEKGIDIDYFGPQFKEIIKLHGYVPFKKLWENAGEKSTYLFRYGLPVVKDLITDIKSLENIGKDLIQLSIAAGEKAQSLFQYGLPAVKELIIDRESLRKISNELIQLDIAAGEKSLFLSKYGLFEVKELFGNEFKAYWSGLAQLGIAARENSWVLFRHALPMVKELFGNEFKVYWPGLAQLGIAAEKNSLNLFLYGLPAVKELITDRKSLKNISNDLLKILSLCEGTQSQTLEALSKLSPLFKQFPSSWDKFIKPVIYNQTVSAFLCLEAVSRLYKQETIQSENDFIFIKELILSQGIRAYDVLENFLEKGITEGIILKPISNEKDSINTFLSKSEYLIIELYQSYKNNPEEINSLVARCDAIHEKILAADTSSVEKDPFFSAMLLYVFPPTVTTQRKQYQQLYDSRPDRPEDTKDIPLNLQKIKPFEVSTGKYILKDPTRPLDETPWKTLLGITKKVNKETPADINEEEIKALGKELLKHWQGNTINEQRKVLLTKLYSYYRNSRNSMLPESLSTIPNIMALKEFVGDTQRDLIAECIKKYQESDTQGYQTIIDKMFKSKIENPKKGAKIVLSILTQIKNNPDKAKQAIGKALGIEDEPTLNKVWEKVKDKTDSQEIAKALAGITFKRQPAKEAQLISQQLQGKEYRAMQGEFSSKYEFNEAGDKLSLFLITSKRKAHGITGFNMGVCITPDEKLWDNPNFINVIIFDQEKKIALGGMHILIIEDNGKKYLTLPGINPSPSLLAKVNADDIYNKLISYAGELATILNCESVLIPTNATIHSNRSEMQRIISARNYQELSLSKIHKFSYSPYAYSFENTFLALEVTKAAIKKTASNKLRQPPNNQEQRIIK